MMVNQNKSLLKKNLSSYYPSGTAKRIFKIFMITSEGPIHHSIPQSENLTVEQAIQQSLHAFSQSQLKINRDLFEYNLFIARKNGYKNQDYPSLELHQPLIKFGYNRFYLEGKSQGARLKAFNSISTMKSIEGIHTNFIKKKSDEQTEVYQQSSFCGCMWKK